jgi:spore germination protein KA
MIVVVALTAVASYAIPVTEMGTTIRILGLFL